MENKKYHTVGTVPKSNCYIIETETKESLTPFCTSVSLKETLFLQMKNTFNKGKICLKNVLYYLVYYRCIDTNITGIQI